MSVRLSLIIPAKSKDDPKLADLLRSIEAQDFPKEELEVLVITEGTSESAKAIGIRRAKGEVIGILASDNVLNDREFLTHMMRPLEEVSRLSGAYPGNYSKSNLDILGRYFALMGGNDPLAYYMGKNDRYPIGHWPSNLICKGDYTVIYFDYDRVPSLGDNGFFVFKEIIESTNLDNYYHIDNPCEAVANGANAYAVVRQRIVHNTGGNIFKFFQKRYRYGLQHAFNPNRRWHLVDFRRPKDILRLLYFILCAVTFIEPLCLSVRGYLKVRDIAWFLHPVTCFLTVVTYGLLCVHVGLSRLSQSLFARMAVQRA